MLLPVSGHEAVRIRLETAQGGAVGTRHGINLSGAASIRLFRNIFTAIAGAVTIDGGVDVLAIRYAGDGRLIPGRRPTV
jgi:hypothetical protein